MRPNKVKTVAVRRLSIAYHAYVYILNLFKISKTLIFQRRCSVSDEFFCTAFRNVNNKSRPNSFG